jgi:predicted O-methyltransferase YrrM
MNLHEYLEQYCKQYHPSTYLEIGTREGNSLKVVLTNSKNINEVFVCDTWGSLYGGTGKANHSHISDMINKVGYTGKINYLDGDSKIEIPKLNNNNYFDLILVDGDHSAEGGLLDLENVLQLAKRGGGCILFHDITHHAHLYLEQVFDSFAEKYSSLWRESPQKIREELGIGVLFT